jgi:hypothetical protein
MNDSTRPDEPHYELPGVASYYPRHGRLRTSIDSPVLAAVGNTFWTLALLAGAAAVLTIDPRFAPRLLAYLQAPSTVTVDPQLWLHLALAAGAAFLVGRIIHSTNNHHPSR